MSYPADMIFGKLWLCPHLHRSHAFLGVKRRQQVFLTQEIKGKMNHYPSDCLQLFRCLLIIGVTKAFLAGVLLQLPLVTDRVAGQTSEDL